LLGGTELPPVCRWAAVLSPAGLADDRRRLLRRLTQ
jgi:hypothetical protein